MTARRGAATGLLAFILGSGMTARAEIEFKVLPRAGAPDLSYALVLPDRFDPERTYPALLALPPGDQSREMVEAGLGRYWGKQAARAGWIVVSPVARRGTSFWTGGESVIPELLAHIMTIARVEGGRFHLAGTSNGGRSAFRIAGLRPELFASLTVLPGFPPTEADRGRLAALGALPITMYVGGEDGEWLAETRRTEAELRRLGIPSTVVVLDGEGHVPPSLDGDVIVRKLESLRLPGL